MLRWGVLLEVLLGVHLLMPINGVPFPPIWIGICGVFIALGAKVQSRQRCANSHAKFDGSQRKGTHTTPSLRFQTDSVTPLTVRVILLSATQRPSGPLDPRVTWLYTRTRLFPGFIMSSNPP
jgi:hypothetical protein